MKYGVFHLMEKLDTTNIWETIALKYIVMCSSLFVSLFILNFIKLPERIAYYGRFTLFIYCIHAPMYPLMIRYCHSQELMVLSTIITIVFLTYLGTTRLSRILLYPFTTTMNRFFQYEKR